MKIRTGFVSNSSSSSFVVLQKAPADRTQKDIDKSNKKKLIDGFGYEDDEYLTDILKDYKGKVIIEIGSVGQDTEMDSFGNTLKKILNAFNIKDITIKWLEE
jgi:hypothetical protein